MDIETPKKDPFSFQKQQPFEERPYLNQFLNNQKIQEEEDLKAYESSDENF